MNSVRSKMRVAAPPVTRAATSKPREPMPWSSLSNWPPSSSKRPKNGVESLAITV